MAAISKNICHTDPIFHVRTLWVFLHISARYEVSMINPVTGQLYTDNTNDNDDNDNTNDTRWTNHDCKGSLACMPNEPKGILWCDNLGIFNAEI